MSSNHTFPELLNKSPPILAFTAFGGAVNIFSYLVHVLVPDVVIRSTLNTVPSDLIQFTLRPAPLYRGQTKGSQLLFPPVTLTSFIYPDNLYCFEGTTVIPGCCHNATLPVSLVAYLIATDFPPILPVSGYVN